MSGGAGESAIGSEVCTHNERPGGRAAPAGGTDLEET